MKKSDFSKKIKEEIFEMGMAIPGTIRTVKLKCGSPNCRCRSGKNEDKHGPYYFWDRKVKGKLTSTSVPKDKVAQIKMWIKNRQKLEKLVTELLDRGQKAAVKELSDR